MLPPHISQGRLMGQWPCLAAHSGEEAVLAAEEGTAEVTCQLSGTLREITPPEVLQDSSVNRSHPGKNCCHPIEISAGFGETAGEMLIREELGLVFPELSAAPSPDS